VRKINPFQHGEEVKDGVIKSLWVVDEPMRGYGKWRGTFVPFVSMLSIHIEERYECRGDVLVMREGSYGRFSVTLRGRVFFASLAQFVTESSPWRFRQLPYSSMRLSYRQLAKHRAAVFVPLMPGTKVTMKDLLTMQMPLFMPGLEMQASISAQWACVAQFESNAPPWVLTQCRTEEMEPWLPLSGFMRHPYVQHFESLTDLVMKLAAMDCNDLTALSASMGRWNEALINDDAKFWQTAIEAMRPPGGSAASSSSTAASTATARYAAGTSAAARMGARGAGVEAGAAALSAGTAPIEVSWPRPTRRLTVVEDPRENCDVPEAAYCKHHRRGDQWTEECCGLVLLLHEQHPQQAADEPPASVPARERCLWKESECDQNVLRFSTHLLQELPSIT